MMARFECLICSVGILSGPRVTSHEGRRYDVHMFGLDLEAQVNDKFHLHSWALRRASYRQIWTHHTVVPPWLLDMGRCGE